MFVIGLVFLLAVVILIVFTKEWLRRKREGFFVNTKGNADGGDLIYHEGQRSLTFYFDRPARTVYVPSNKRWGREMPEWARIRKSEIVDRIKRRLGQSWRVEDKAD